jgi:hypothetical protein
VTEPPETFEGVPRELGSISALPSESDYTFWYYNFRNSGDHYAKLRVGIKDSDCYVSLWLLFYNAYGASVAIEIHRETDISEHNIEVAMCSAVGTLRSFLRRAKEHLESLGEATPANNPTLWERLEES